MLEPSGFIELIMCVNESEPKEKGTRCGVLRIVTGKKCLEPKNIKGVLDGCQGCLERVTASPVLRRDVDAEFRNTRLTLARPETAAADMFAGLKKKDRPVLNAVTLL
jgi:hypothetical protein